MPCVGDAGFGGTHHAAMENLAASGAEIRRPGYRPGHRRRAYIPCLTEQRFYRIDCGRSATRAEQAGLGVVKIAQRHQAQLDIKSVRPARAVRFASLASRVSNG